MCFINAFLEVVNYAEVYFVEGSIKCVYRCYATPLVSRLVYDIEEQWICAVCNVALSLDDNTT